MMTMRVCAVLYALMLLLSRTLSKTHVGYPQSSMEISMLFSCLSLLFIFPLTQTNLLWSHMVALATFIIWTAFTQSLSPTMFLCTFPSFSPNFSHSPFHSTDSVTTSPIFLSSPNVDVIIYFQKGYVSSNFSFEKTICDTQIQTSMPRGTQDEGSDQ